MQSPRGWTSKVANCFLLQERLCNQRGSTNQHAPPRRARARASPSSARMHGCHEFRLTAPPPGSPLPPVPGTRFGPGPFRAAPCVHARYRREGGGRVWDLTLQGALMDDQGAPTGKSWRKHPHVETNAIVRGGVWPLSSIKGLRQMWKGSPRLVAPGTWCKPALAQAP